MSSNFYTNSLKHDVFILVTWLDSESLVVRKLVSSDWIGAQARPGIKYRISKLQVKGNSRNGAVHK